MSTLNPGQSRIVAGKPGDEFTEESDLIKNQNLFPEIKKMIWRVDKRQMSTLLTSGAVTPYGINMDASEKFGKIPEGNAIGASSVQFGVQGRISKSSVILSQVGASGADGTFTLLMADKYMYKGQYAVFGNARRYVALCLAEPTKTAGGWLYNMQNLQGEVFIFATHAAPNNNGTSTLFPTATAYGEGSTKGYSRNENPDRFIVDMTIQRSTVSITGDAASDRTWYEYMGTEGLTRGWKYEVVRQAEARFAWQNEWQKIFGVTTMKNPDGSRKAVSDIIDVDAVGSGVITAGDGIEEQISGGNEIYGSGTNGNITEDDFIDAMGLLTKTSNSTSNGVNLVFMTGLDGWYNFQRISARFAIAQGGQIWQQEKGGANVEVGYTFNKITFGGSSVTVIVHPMFDDQELFPALGSDGKSIMSGTYIGGDLGSGTQPNVEIIPKGWNGSNRSNVTAELNGMTGLPGQVITQTDAMSYAMLKQDLIAIYDTRRWVILRKS